MGAAAPAGAAAQLSMGPLRQRTGAQETRTRGTSQDGWTRVAPPIVSHTDEKSRGELHPLGRFKGPSSGESKSQDTSDTHTVLWRTAAAEEGKARHTGVPLRVTRPHQTQGGAAPHVLAQKGHGRDTRRTPRKSWGSKLPAGGEVPKKGEERQLGNRDVALSLATGKECHTRGGAQG